ncbi:hypothetical protein [Thioalbus denitrificans]|uniref:Uncharacterized protein n=1 Tax=Thioalbus denitrificans TaxID=547122 RepID=A0A369CFU2_9GAMM|nr:hypothetical protein [Thioalbus denitrificans]RCX32108.1 hypothetical protein DFQ59_102461 [Thioalbus denitrificans]
MKPRKPRQCSLCGRFSAPGTKECPYCGTRLVRPRFVMNKSRIAKVHTIAARKGLIDRKTGDDELYRLHLGAVGVSSSKQMKRGHYRAFLERMQKLPDIRPGRGAQC